MKCAVIFAIAFAIVAQAAILPNFTQYKGNNENFSFKKPNFGFNQETEWLEVRKPPKVNSPGKPLSTREDKVVYFSAVVLWSVNPLF